MLPALTRRTSTWPDTTDWMDREFGRMMRRFWDDTSNGESVSTAFYPVNIWEDDDAVHVEAELPGFKRDEIEVTLEQGLLSISAQRGQENQPESRGSSLLNERRFVRYHRTFTLPSSVDDNKVEARLEDGVLHLTMPKRAEVKPRRIKVS
jgi:HSP20 family protein